MAKNECMSKGAVIYIIANMVVILCLLVLWVVTAPDLPADTVVVGSTVYMNYTSNVAAWNTYFLQNILISSIVGTVMYISYWIFFDGYKLRKGSRFLK